MNNPQAKPGTALIKKLVEVAKAIGTITKSGYNKHQNYHYATEADLIEAVKSELLNRNVFIFTTSKVTQVDKLTKVETDKEGNKKESTSLVTSVETIHTFFDADSGESYSVASAGSGHDATDKGVFKAITGATKYFLSKNFMIASEDDPENDGGVTKPQAKPAATSGGLFAKKAAPAAAPTPEVTAPKKEGQAAAPAQQPVEKPVAVTTPATVAAPSAPATLPKVSNGAGTAIAKPVFNKNKAANENVKF